MEKNRLQLMEKCFRAAMINGELSDSSIVKYRDSIHKFFKEIHKNFNDLTIKDFEDFIFRMKQNGASSSRIANVISAMKWVISKLQTNCEIKRGLDLEKVKKPKISRKEVNYLTEQETKRFIDAIKADDTKGMEIRKYRFLALVIFLLQTGARIGEALSINITDIDRENLEVQIVGKGKKVRTLLLVQSTLDVLDQYLEKRTDSHEAIFVALNGQSRWQQTDVGRSFRRYKKASGIKKNFVIHTLRHTFATRHLLNHTPINTVQYLLGHSNLETTMKYYIGSVEKSQARQYIKDEYFEFIA